MDHLKSILDKESISYDEEAVILIAKRGDGSVRDCLSILSQLVAGSDGYISAELVREVLGIAPAEAKIQILEAVLKKRYPFYCSKHKIPFRSWNRYPIFFGRGYNPI